MYECFLLRFLETKFSDDSINPKAAFVFKQLFDIDSNRRDNVWSCSPSAFIDYFYPSKYDTFWMRNPFSLSVRTNYKLVQWKDWTRGKQTSYEMLHGASELAGSYEHGNEPTGSIKGGKFLV